MRAQLCIGALIAVAALRSVEPAVPATALGAGYPRLPATLLKTTGERLALGPSEVALLAQNRSVRIDRRRYRQLEATLLSSEAVRTLHPPEVCLRSDGLEVIEREERNTHDGCRVVLALRQRHPAHSAAHTTKRFLAYAFFSDDGNHLGALRCGALWAAALAQLGRRPLRWTALSVMAPDKARAMRAFNELYQRIERGERR
ncbi:MAG: hypothetical protein H6707_15905 [Deltaproteobacteria bacterium]|nr:hypothetical protein [Deltaproteobacteria bacterium]